jgi:hypothetical protein
MAITVRPLTVADVDSDAPLFGAYLDFCGMVLYEKLGYTTDTNFRVYALHLPS